MAAQRERFSDFFSRQKIPILIVAGAVSLTAVASYLAQFRTPSLPPALQPTPGLVGSGGGELLEALPTDSLSDPTSGRCVSIGGLPPGHHTSYSALGQLSVEQGWQFPSDERVVLRHRLGDNEDPVSVKDALAENKIVFDADAWCPK